MATYTLTAQLKDDSESITIEAQTDSEAMLDSIAEIMDRAYPNKELWGNGAITLTDPNGVIVQTMAEKPTR